MSRHIVSVRRQFLLLKVRLYDIELDLMRARYLMTDQLHRVFEFIVCGFQIMACGCSVSDNG